MASESESSAESEGGREVEAPAACGSGCFLPLLEEEDRTWSSFLAEEASHEGGQILHGLPAICTHEELFLKKIRSLRKGPSSGHRLAVAFSGGGVRAAFVATGVLWRLAACGRLKDVDYISGVSGGTYAVTAFASHIVAAGKPAAGEELDGWYLRIIAKMIARMQNNTPYLSRDLSREVPSSTQRGSGMLPRCCDVPQLMVVALGTMLRAPLAVTATLILPVVEIIEVLYGSDMRAEFCRDIFSNEHLVLSVGGCSTSQQQALVFLTMIVIAILVHLGQNFLKQYIDQKGGEAQLKRALCWMFLRSCLSVVIRLLCCWVLLSLLIAGPVAWRLYRYNSVLGGTELRFCQCTQFLHSQDHCDVHFGEVGFTSEGFQQRWAVYANLTQMGLVSNISDCHPSWTNAQGPEAQTLMDQAEAWLLHRPLQQTFLPVFLLLVMLTLFAAGLLLPIVPEFFVLIFNIFVPVLLLAFTFFLVQFRVLGPITQERYFGYELNREVWSYMLQVTLLGAMIGLGFSRFIRTFMHRYYSRSLHRAFYAKGENCTWADVRRNIYCPMLLINATVNDYMQLGDSKPFSYMTFTQLFSGGSRLGYYSAYGQRPLARTAALSGGAIDGFILGDSDSMSLRFWLEASGFFMGDFVSISRSPGEWVRVQRYLALLVLEVVYILLFIASWLTSGHSLKHCQMQLRLVRVAAWWWLSIGILSFFSFFDCLGWLQHSPVIRTMQQATMFYYQSPRIPRSVYLSDGGVLENTGILALLQRRQRRIVAMYCGEEAKGQEMGCLHKLLQTMHDEDIGYLYDLKDPRRGPLYAIRECAWYNDYLLELGIFYYDHPEQDDNILTVLRNKIPPGRPSSIWKHLSEEEVLNLQPSELDETFEDMEQSDLGGCCCDCCHKTWCNRCMGRFPSPPTANQFLTPQMFNALCRLGYDLPAEVLHRL